MSKKKESIETKEIKNLEEFKAFLQGKNPQIIDDMMAQGTLVYDKSKYRVVKGKNDVYIAMFTPEYLKTIAAPLKQRVKMNALLKLDKFIQEGYTLTDNTVDENLCISKRAVMTETHYPEVTIFELVNGDGQVQHIIVGKKSGYLIRGSLAMNRRREMYMLDNEDAVREEIAEWDKKNWRKAGLRKRMSKEEREAYEERVDRVKKFNTAFHEYMSSHDTVEFVDD